MSYCRWSSDDYQCDVYVYDSVGDFFAIHVAGTRQTPATPPPPRVEEWWNRGEEGIAAYMAREKAVEAWLATAERKPLGLPHDGETLQEPDAASCADRLEYLRGLGYNVPQYAIDALREEAIDDARQGEQPSDEQSQLSVNAEGTPASSEPDEQNPVSRSSLPNRSVLPREPL